MPVPCDPGSLHCTDRMTSNWPLGVRAASGNSISPGWTDSRHRADTAPSPVYDCRPSVAGVTQKLIWLSCWRVENSRWIRGDDTSALFSLKHTAGYNQVVHVSLTWGLDRKGLVVRGEGAGTLFHMLFPPLSSESHSSCACLGYLLVCLAAQL